MDCKKRSVGSLFENDKGHAFYQPSFHFTLYTCHDNLNHPVDKTIKRYSKIKITVICPLTAFFVKCISLSKINFGIISYVQRTRFADYFCIVAYQ
jgi:hypothetical protein